MTKRIFLAFLLALLPFASCSVRDIDLPAVEDDVVSITLDPGAMGVTRATAYGEDKFNENVIKTFRLYFYAAGATDDAEAVYVYPESGFAADHPNESAAVGADMGVDPTTGKVTVRLKLTESHIDGIFPSMSSCRVYAVANLGEGVELPASTSVNSLKKTVLTASFGPDASVAEEPFAKVRDSFAMDGEGTLTLDRSKRSASGEVKMYRAASKITFKVAKVTKDGVEDKEWEPQTGEMRVAFINGVNRGYLNGSMDKAAREGESGEFLFSYKTTDRNYSRRLAGDETAGWTHELPFYSYYNLWRDAENPSNADCGGAPYLLLSLPWKHNTTGRYFTCYYAVPFNTIAGRLDRNTWYQVNLSVGILGSGDPDNPTEITPSYMILPWGNEVVTNANLMRYRYLMVDENEYEMHNIDALSIPFISSHPVEVAEMSLTYTRLKPLNGIYKPDENVAVDKSKYSVTINEDNSGFVFTHTLVNDYTKDYDVSAYTLTVKLWHKDKHEFYETLTIVQYPPLYVRAELNSACTGDPERGTYGNSTNRGYVYVNGYNSNSSFISSWMQVSDYSNAGNRDPYMYVVNVSSLPSGSEYIIGDPRTASYDSGFYTGWRQSLWLYGSGSNHRLTYYYPGEETDRVHDMIAPSFRIASSYGVVGTIEYSDAKQRCAGYQEDGYPAGRWRLPTPAEIKYMAMLAGDGKIPVLLSLKDSDGYTYYWSADGKAYSPDGPNPGNTESWQGTYYNYVRCVYDDWYWTDKCTKNQFTWGDKQK